MICARNERMSDSNIKQYCLERIGIVLVTTSMYPITTSVDPSTSLGARVVVMAGVCLAEYLSNNLQDGL